MWERACSRKRSVSRYIRRLNHCFREQARSHILGLWCSAFDVFQLIKQPQQGL